MVIDKKLIQSLFDQAVVNPRLRINYLFRTIPVQHSGDTRSLFCE